MWVFLGEEMLNERVGESNLEDWSKRVVNGMGRFFVNDQYAIGKKRD